MYYDSRKMTDYHLEYQERKKTALLEETQSFENKRSNLFESRANRENIAKQYNQFKESVLENLVEEVIYHVLEQSMDNIDHNKINFTDEDKIIARNLVHEYVHEEDALKILNEIEPKTYLLATCSGIVKGTFDRVFENVEPEQPATYSVKPSVSKDFFDKLDGVKFDTVVNRITDKVCKATEEFVECNKKDKEKMESAAEDIKKKIDSVKAKNPEDQEDIKQEFANLYRQTINGIVSNRKQCLFEYMVRKNTNEILQDNTIFESYVTESGSPDTLKIINKTAVMYTFLETLNTLKIKNIDSEFIKENIL